MSRSLCVAVHCDSISTVPSSPLAMWLKLDHAHPDGSATKPRFTGFWCMYLSFSRRFLSE
jgi:hypothetical protein